MDVRLSSEQRELRDAVARLVADHGPRAVGDLDDTARVQRLERALALTGWRELRVATDDGAPLASGVELAIVAEQLARGPADTAFTGPVLAAELRRLCGAAASDEPETVLLAADLARLADGDDGGAVAIDAAGATRALTVHRRSGAATLVSVPVTRGAGSLDLTRPTARPCGPAVPVEHANVIDDDVPARLGVLAAAVSTADLVGAMDGTLRLAVEYVTARHQYGRPVGSFQAVQHLLADGLALTEGSRSIALHAAWAVDALPLREAITACATATAYVARSARTVCETSIQVHGGIGNTWECMAHVFLRRTLVSTDLFGGIAVGLDRVLAHHGIGAR